MGNREGAMSQQQQQSPYDATIISRINQLQEQLLQDAPKLPCACGASAPVTRYIKENGGTEVAVGTCTGCGAPLAFIPMIVNLRHGPAKLASVMFWMVDHLIGKLGP